jgi:endoglucanase
MSALADVHHDGDHLIPSGYLQVSGVKIVDGSGNPVRLAGVNWYGFECDSLVAGGLDHQPLTSICRQIATLGFNVIRLPFSVEAVRNNPTISRSLEANPSLQGLTVLQIMDALINTAGRYGLKVILDCHRSHPGWSAESNGLWYTEAYPESIWISTWQAIVQRYADTAHIEDASYVIGADLRNEPGAPPPSSSAWPQNNGSVWGYSDPSYDTAIHPDNWPVAVQRAGNAVLSVNPNLLIFVEGVRHDPAGLVFDGSHHLYWPGGNLMGVGNPGGPRRQPLAIDLTYPDGSSARDRLVYSAHDYGPDMHRAMAWCRLDRSGQGTGATDTACYSVWDQTWGYIVKEGIGPIWLGEFGTVNGYKANDRTPPQDYTDINPDYVPQGYWFTYLVNYLNDLQKNYHAGNWCYWCLNGTQSQAPGRNPSKAEGYGVLDPTWTTVASRPMMNKLTSML